MGLFSTLQEKGDLYTVIFYLYQIMWFFGAMFCMLVALFTGISLLAILPLLFLTVMFIFMLRSKVSSLIYTEIFVLVCLFSALGLVFRFLDNIGPYQLYFSILFFSAPNGIFTVYLLEKFVDEETFYRSAVSLAVLLALLYSANAFIEEYARMLLSNLESIVSNPSLAPVALELFGETPYNVGIAFLSSFLFFAPYMSRMKKRYLMIFPIVLFVTMYILAVLVVPNRLI